MCNQEIYDMIYKNLVLHTIDSDFTQISLDAKNDGIELLRKLCNGQLSSWEKGRNEDPNKH
jgi:hypothetical protein